MIKSIKKNSKQGLLGIVVGFINGLLGSGGGALLVPSLERFLKVEEHKAHATAIAVILPLSMISSFVYIQNGVVDWSALLFVAIGGTCGGFIGSKLLGKIPAIWLHRLFGIVLIVAGVRMVMR